MTALGASSAETRRVRAVVGVVLATSVIMKTITRLLALFAVLMLLSCTKSNLRAESAQSEGVIVQPMRVWIGGHKLWVRVDVTNEGEETILVDRDEIVARLPSGQTVGRALGRTSLHSAYVVPPHASHLVYVEFEEQGFDWDTVPRATIDFTPAITRGSRHVAIEMPVGL